MRFVLACAILFASACGYRTAGHADLVPKTIHTIAIPAFGNATTRYKLTDQLPQAIAREFIARTRYRIVSDPDTADAVLSGSVLTYTSFPTVFDPKTTRASAVEVHVTMRLDLVERATGKKLYSRPNFEMRERYQISIDPAAFFEESDAALARASEQTAQQVVSAILNNF
ncbi:MAG: LPS assembly lipoprotein LptE [Acidobacteriota bacterium]|nr:LPS assembly lipoprotein LptE [Acidobacteriota bacterium]